MAENLPIQSRPSPDALLAAATAESRGKLKIFLGAAPGVGKTFEMLQAARRKKADDIDVVVGIVETHGRSETAALLEGLEIIPRQSIPYKGRFLEEMDLDAILKRRPALVLVDELAHTNAPGCRHPKRYQDVEELLAAGIDVYSTLNIQHVESLNDVVAKITRVRVRETVPDRIVDKADDIEVVDLTPEELLERLSEGKVYVKEQAARAIRHYFQPGNLTALRELALRRTAERVDAQMVSYMRAHAIQGPWPAGERIMALIDETPAAASLIRYAKRMAERLRATWVTVHIETARDQTLSDDDRARIAANLRLAEHLGGEALSLPGGNIVSDVLALAAETNVTHIILGKSKRSRWFEMLHGSVVHELVARSSGLSVHVMASDTEKAPAPRETLAQPAEVSEFRWEPYFGAALYVAMATACGLALEHYVRIHNVALVYVPAVMASAVRHGRWPGLAGAFFAMLAYNYFFLEPRHELTISDPANLVAFVFFTVISILVSSLAARVRQQTLSARRQARTTAALYGFSRKIAGVAALDDLLWAAAYQVATMLKCEVVILLPDKSGMLEVRGGFPPEDQLDDADVAAAKWAYDRDQPAGRGSDTLPGGRRLFLPLRTGRGKVGVLGVQRQGAEELLSPDERRLVDALADQIAIAIERIRLADDVDASRLLAESERLRSALLTSISHDLKTPLAAILGAITSLRRFKDLYDRDTIDELMATVQDEAERLSRFVANLLDMTRLDAGAVQPKIEIFDLGDAVGAALKRTSRLLTHHKVVVDIAADLPMLKLDFVLLETILVNLLDNAAKYAPPGTTVEISARQTPSGVLVEIRDHGPGIPAADQARIFEKFYRAESGDRQRAGTGLGLAICRGFVESMGGSIAMRNAPDGGALFSITFPATALAPPLPEKV